MCTLILDGTEYYDTATAAALLGMSPRSLTCNHRHNKRLQQLECRRFHSLNLWLASDVDYVACLP